jgi:two-component system chemotaxis response regulator CheB
MTKAGSGVRLVVMGTSLGGMQALETILHGLMPDFPLPIAIVQHRGVDWGVQSELTRLLQLHCALPLTEAGDKDPIRSGCVYLAPADYHLLVEEDRFALSVDARLCHARPSIDVLFESAAVAYREGVLAVVLTGASADGAVGARRVRECGGSVVAQDPATAESPVMPRAAIATGVVDCVLPLSEIAAYLNVASVRHR